MIEGGEWMEDISGYSRWTKQVDCCNQRANWLKLPVDGALAMCGGEATG